jgi:radical SAM protein with 4Fe4S-binding SPASM domain
MMVGPITSLRNRVRQIREYQRYFRHIRSLTQHATPQKLRNLMMVELEYRRRAIHLRGRPYKIIVDPCNICYGGCLLCPTGMNELRRARRMMDLKTFQAVVDVIKPYAFEVSLHNWGEALLNPHIYPMIAYAQANNIGTNLSSTLATADSEDMDRIIQSGLEYLVVSLNGTSPETYNAYVPGGNLSKVLDNLGTLIRRRTELGSRLPLIEWQFLVMRPNEHELPKARDMAREIGVDRLRFTSAGLPMGRFHDRPLAKAWMPSNPKYWRLNPLKLEKQAFLLDQPCFYLFRSITVNPDGALAPCCGLYDEQHDFGNLLDDGLEGLWNNERYRSARASFARGSERGMPRTICTSCQLFRHPRTNSR